MTLRTFPLSRQRRRHIQNRTQLVPVEDGQRLSAPADDEAVSASRDERSRRDNGEGPYTKSSGATPVAARLPHEHDEHTDKPQAPRRVISQAQADLAAGLQDTDLRNSAATIMARSKPGKGGGS